MPTAPTTAHSMTIAGREAVGDQTFDVINPATGDVFDRAPACSEAQLDAAMDAAATAFPNWRLDEFRRREALKTCATAIQANIDELADILTREQGKPLARAKAEIRSAATWFPHTRPDWRFRSKWRSTMTASGSRCAAGRTVS